MFLSKPNCTLVGITVCFFAEQEIPVLLHLILLRFRLPDISTQVWREYPVLVGLMLSRCSILVHIPPFKPHFRPFMRRSSLWGAADNCLRQRT